MVTFVQIPAFGHVSLDTKLSVGDYAPNESVILMWHIEISHNQENWDLMYSVDGRESWIDIERDLPTETLEYEWKLPDIQADSVVVRIVQDNMGFDYFDDSDFFSIGTVTVVREITQTTRSHFDLDISPNPVFDQANVHFSLEQNSRVFVDILDLTGKEYAVLFPCRILPSGDYNLPISKNGFGHGYYILRLVVDKEVETRKVVVF